MAFNLKKGIMLDYMSKVRSKVLVQKNKSQEKMLARHDQQNILISVPKDKI